MYIRRKVFSLLHDETGEERYFSTTEINLEDAEERIFSVNEEVSLEDVKSHKGLKRALAAGLLTLDAGGGLIGGYAGKKAANKADKEGKSDEEILKEARKTGRNVAAGTGVGLSALLARRRLKKFDKLGSVELKGKKKAALIGASALIGGGLSALGGRNAASVNTKDRLAKRAMKEREDKKD